MKIFDILVVYSAKLAISADTLRTNAYFPFAVDSKNESYNTVYGYFLKTCQRVGLTAGFTTSADIIGPGKCSCYWILKKGKWLKVSESCYSTVIFDKFSPTNRRIKENRDLLFSLPLIKPFNDHYLYELFFDKQKTYGKLKTFSIPTATIKNNTVSGVMSACKTLRKLVQANVNGEDFASEIVLKDRFGAGGIDVYKFSANDTQGILCLLKRHINKSFIIQPLIKFDRGFSYKKLPVAADIRLIYFDNKVIQTYIRTAKKGDFRCNEHQGGTLKYIPKRMVPKSVIATSAKIANKLNRHSSLYALDFIISNNGNIYLLEGNTGPGLDWNLALKENEVEAKKLIRIVVKKLGIMVNESKTVSNKTSFISQNMPLLADPFIIPVPLFVQV